MKFTWLLILFLAIYWPAFGQRVFVLDFERNDTLFYRNIISPTDHRSSVAKFNLDFLKNAKIDTVECGEKEKIRDVFIRSGLVKLQDTTINNRELKLEREARSIHFGYWAINTDSITNIPDKFDYKQSKYNQDIQTNLPASVKKLVARQAKQKKPSTYPIIDSGTIVKYCYRRLEKNLIFFDNITTGDTSTTLLMDGLVIDYFYLHEFNCYSNQDIRLYLIGIGAVGLKHPSSKNIKQEERKNYHLSQIKRLGMWHNNSPRSNPQPTIREKNPPSNKKQDIIKPENWLMKLIKDYKKK